MKRSVLTLGKRIWLLLAAVAVVYVVAPSAAARRNALDQSGPTARWLHIALWTGDEMLIWGGSVRNESGMNIPVEDGWRYNPQTNSWRPISSAGAPSPRISSTGIWTGQDMIVWGGFSGGGRSNEGAAYNPRNDTWRALATDGAPIGRTFHTAVWTGSEMIVWGGEGESGFLSDGARFNPSTGVWTPLAQAGAPQRRAFHQAVWTGSDMIIWGGYERTTPTRFNDGARYDPNVDSWRPVSAVGAPPPALLYDAGWTGKEMILWSSDGGARYDPSVDRWNQISTAGAVRSSDFVWTGSELVVWAGRGARYNPERDSWTAASNAGAPTVRSGHSVIWSGKEVIVWGGSAGRGELHDGGRYDPAADSWTRLVGLAPTFDCEAFVADVTVPDGTLVSPGQLLDKAWRLSNCGDTTWEGYRAAKVSGRFGPSNFDVPTTKPGEQAELRALLQAPTVPGCYRATYRIEGPRGGFGPGFFAEVVVEESGESGLGSIDDVAARHRLIVPTTALGAEWCDVSVEGDSGGNTPSVRYRNDRGVQFPLEATFSLSTIPDEYESDPDAAILLVGLLSASAASERVTELDQSLSLGDGAAVKAARVDRNDRYAAIHYVFRVANILAFVELRGRGLPEIETDALRFARLQEERLKSSTRAALDESELAEEDTTPEMSDDPALAPEDQPTDLPELTDTSRLTQDEGELDEIMPEVVTEEATPVTPPEATVTPTVTPTAAARALLRDNFEDPANSLLPGSSPEPSNYVLRYAEGEYLMRVVNSQWATRFPALVLLPGLYQDTSLAIDVRLVGDPRQKYVAVGCRSRAGAGQYRLLVVPSGGAMTLVRWDGGDNWTTLAPARTVEAIRRDTATNRLELSCVGSTIMGTINGTVVATVQDATHREGLSWIALGSPSGAAAEARWDNLVLTEY